MPAAVRYECVAGRRDCFTCCSAIHVPTATNAATGQSTTPSAATTASPPHQSTLPVAPPGSLLPRADALGIGLPSGAEAPLGTWPDSPGPRWPGTTACWAAPARGDDSPEPPAAPARGDDPPEPPAAPARGDDPPEPPASPARPRAVEPVAMRSPPTVFGSIAAVP